MPDDAPSESSRSSHSLTWWIVWASFLLFVIYPLSSGPVFRLYEQLSSAPDNQFLLTVYAPLVLLSESFDSVNDFFEWYIGEVWGYQGP